jgi:hypothetical protein
MALSVQVRTVLEYWSIGVLECWQKPKPEFSLHCFFHYSITLPLHHSSRLPLGGKTMEVPSGGSAKPGPLGPDSLLQMGHGALTIPDFGIRELGN